MQIINKKAGFDYQLEGGPIEAGISLKGVEARSLRMGRGDLSSSFVKFIDGEYFLVNANIPASGIQNYDPVRSRKLLLHKKEILSLSTKGKQQKLQIVPISLYNTGRLIKIKLSLGKPKREFEKRDVIKKKDLEREIKKEISNKRSLAKLTW